MTEKEKDVVGQVVYVRGDVPVKVVSEAGRQLQQQLAKPFPPEDIEWRVQSVSVRSGKQYAVVVPYITARAVMDRLDECFGILGWGDSYSEVKLGVDGGVGFQCRLQVGVVGDSYDFVTKVDAAPITHIEPIKGGYSDALKRAAVKFGIGRYLYRLPFYEQEVSRDFIKNGHRAYGKTRNGEVVSGWYAEPELPSWAIPEGWVDPKKSNDGPRSAVPFDGAGYSEAPSSGPVGGAVQKPQNENLAQFEGLNYIYKLPYKHSFHDMEAIRAELKSLGKSGLAKWDPGAKVWWTKSKLADSLSEFLMKDRTAESSVASPAAAQPRTATAEEIAAVVKEEDDDDIPF